MAEAVSMDIEVAEFAGQLFFRLWRASHTRTAQALGSIGLTPAEFAVLNVLGAREGTIQQQLSTDMGIDPSAMVRLINELEEAGLAYRAHRLQLGQGEQRAPAHLALNPGGKVPVLVVRSGAGEPDFILSQSNAILFFAEERAPGRLLPPNGSMARIRALEAYFYFVTDVIAINGVAFTLKIQGLSDAAARLTQQCVSAIQGSERFLSAEGFMGGDRFSMADIAAYTIITAMSGLLPWDQLRQLAAWHERIGQRPAIQKGMVAFGAAAAA